MYAWPKFHGSSPYSFRENDLKQKSLRRRRRRQQRRRKSSTYVSLLLRRRDKNTTISWPPPPPPPPPKKKKMWETLLMQMLLTILFYSILSHSLGRSSGHHRWTILFHLDLFSAALTELAKSIPVHSLILSSHLFFCLPLFLFPFTVPCTIVFAKPEDLETWPNHLSFRFLTRVRSSSYSPMAAWIFLQTSSLVTWSLCEMFNSLR